MAVLDQDIVGIMRAISLLAQDILNITLAQQTALAGKKYLTPVIMYTNQHVVNVYPVHYNGVVMA